MSDDEFGDDSFLVDDSFLREVDNIAASAQVNPKAAISLHRSTSLAPPAVASTAGKGWTGIQRSHSGPSSKPHNRITLQPQVNRQPPPQPSSSRLHAHPSSDDYDALLIPAESLAAFDSFTSRPGPPPNPSSSSTSRPPTSSNRSQNGTIPSSRLGVGRSGGNATSGFLQTHLNFRRDKQSTKGKRWDRTEFAESGRRVGAEKGKAKGKGKGAAGANAKRRSRDWDEDDEEELEDEDDWGDVMAPAPIPLVDISVPYEPQRHLPNTATVGTYIYPTNRSKRDYQFDIVQACFTDNCLVALPTGLGKTFVAGVVMLNFYRWFPTGKIVFLAPTRPLVNQQIEACQLSCGIPSRDAAVMTGSSVSAKERARLWEERRVFYCTPQTLDNDLKKGSVDPRDIVLAVFDEAHKASGSYAYTTILAYITAHHPYFRVLALTATPGADVPRVQAVVDALHISRIEIREAEAPEIRKYMNEKHTEKHFVQMGDVIEGFRDRWAALMKPFVAKLVDKDILTERDLDIKRLRPFRLTAKRMEIARDRNSGLKWCFGPLQSLEKMARAMGSLLEFSIGMFHTTLSEIAGGTDAAGKKSNTKGGANSIRNNFEFQKLLRDVEAEMNMIRIGKDGRSKADRHPKMVKTLELLLAHFSQAEEEEQSLGQKNDTRAMVFCSYRDCVLEIVEMLNQHSGLLRATKFVGQSQGKQEEDKGFNQKEQKKTINEFKDGKYNILVSTSIGEEGLDIGEVDFVIIYDMPKQSIKLLQRIGRTGRKRDGKVHVLMSENREDANWDTAQATHREIQEEILHSRNLELFEDVEPLLPPGRFPECVEQEMDIDPWNPDDQQYKKGMAEVEKYVKQQKKIQEGGNVKNKAKGKGKKAVGAAVAVNGVGAERNGNGTGGRGHEVPEGAEGFRSVADLLRGAGRLGDRIVLDNDDDEGENEEEAEEARRPAKAKKGKAAPRKSDPTTTSAIAGRKRKRGREPSPVRSESEIEEGEQDLEALFAETGRRSTKRSTTASKCIATKRVRKSKNTTTHYGDGCSSDASEGDGTKRNRSKKVADAEEEHIRRESQKRREEEAELRKKEEEREALNRSALDFFNTEGPLRRSGRERALTPPSSPSPSPNHSHTRALVPPSPSPELDRDPHRQPGNNVLDSLGSPIRPLRQNGAVATSKLTPRTAAMAGFSQIDIEPIEMSWDADDDEAEEEDDRIDPALSSATRLPKGSTRNTPAGRYDRPPGGDSMLPPPVPSSITASASRHVGIPHSPLFMPGSSSPFAPKPTSRETSTPLPATQFPVRRGLGMRRPRPILLSSGGDRNEASPTAIGRRMQDPISPFANLRPPGSAASDSIRGRHNALGIEPGSPVLATLAAARGGRSRRVVVESSSPIAERRHVSRRERKSKVPRKIGQYLEMDASLSGSASDDTSEHSDSSVATSSDERFAGNFAATQAPKGYNQRAMYLAGLGTQAAQNGLAFKRDAAKEREAFLSKARKPVYITDEEDDDDAGREHGQRGEEDSENEYELGSFVVDDEEDMGFMTQSDPLSYP